MSVKGTVTEDIVSNTIKSSLKELKSFTELLNAEFTEEGHDESNREKFKEDISRVLEKFGSAEANLQKTLSALAATRNVVGIADVGDEEEQLNPQNLMKEIDEIINIFEGKSRAPEVEPAFEKFDETQIVSQLEKVEDILNEYNPLKFRDDDEDDGEDDPNEREEQRMSKVLEQFQKKYMKKHDESMLAEDDENAMEVDQADEGSTTESEDEDAENAQASNRPSTSNMGAKKAMDDKLKKMWKDYEKQINDVQLKPLKEIYDKKSSEAAPIPLSQLTHYPAFSKSILELFSQDDIVTCGEKQNYIDPFSKKAIQNPIRNKICQHVYEKDTVCNMIARKKEMGCPNVGCDAKFTIHDLEEDEDLTQKVTQNNERQSCQPSTSANVSNAEYLGDTDYESD
ncbi:uncharacterized protein LOC135832949 [Planococcus citri]|uniref:uncharacterized protein LOC135832949 n=1 Tax=Planococcus citri TaxID=170843 RepID=UPI0031F8F7DB